MADPRIPGRMIRRSIATDRGVSRLTAEQTAIFCMILPHLDGYGKMLGSPHYVKEVALPFAAWATLDIIEGALKAISRNTSVKWFKGRDGRRYLHAIHFERHQLLEKDKRGADCLPSYKSATKSANSRRASYDLVVSELEVNKSKDEEEFKATAPAGDAEAPRASAIPTDQGQEIERNSRQVIPHDVQEWGKRLTVMANKKQQAHGLDPRESDG